MWNVGIAVLNFVTDFVLIVILFIVSILLDIIFLFLYLCGHPWDRSRTIETYKNIFVKNKGNKITK